jgi:hypothetical protein
MDISHPSTRKTEHSMSTLVMQGFSLYALSLSYFKFKRIKRLIPLRHKNMITLEKCC